MSEPKNVIVTGAASGIGQACARDLAAEGHLVLALDLGADALEAAHPGAGNSLVLFAGDVSQPADCEAAVAAAVDRFGGLDAMIHFAAIHSTTPWSELDADEFNRELAVNVTGSFLMSQAAARPMIAQGGGSIVLTTSGIVHIGGVGGAGRGGPAYASSKAAIVALTRSLARSLGADGVRVNAIAPGATETAMTAGYTEEARANVGNAAALGRMGRAEEIADAARFLISDRASYITGEIMNVNGGASFA
ncbi:MAG: SDR family NAD(P)-dependent oxidoreductase [Defluviicoccus sp.]|nr:SDR family NAD(P)-dependent oxidoreductase [Defluviicoccus sp.]MDE0385088.1 SDR family NAD(P)-dependent oxidoreductase [Defluviicoccus sp.]